jgi:hypothetical protein
MKILIYNNIFIAHHYINTTNIYERYLKMKISKEKVKNKIISLNKKAAYFLCRFLAIFIIKID